MGSETSTAETMFPRVKASTPQRAAMTATLPVPRSVSGAATLPGRAVEDPLVALVQRFLNPVVMASTLLLLTLAMEGRITSPYAMLASAVFFLGLYVVTEFPVGQRTDGFLVSSATRRLFIQWLKLAAILLFIGFAAKVSNLYSRKILISWFVFTPVILMAGQAVSRRAFRRMLAAAGSRGRKVIVGANDLAYQLARRIDADPLHGPVVGFFDDRAPDRLPEQVGSRLLGKLDDLRDYVERNTVDAIYVTLPALAHPRMVELMAELQDTTASVYFVPDVFLFDPVRVHVEDVGGMPAIALRETPMRGINSVVKRASDLVLAGGILFFIWPLMFVLAAGVKLSSRGPVLFRQRRYGIDGREIWVYKFRSMTVCEDGENISQARKNDPRTTRFGRFLRKTSLDELPQFLNVLQGTMSVVGPRPHAIAHNEQYRTMIPHYMFRHKIKPGITGWAQVNGLRGETDTLGKMKARLHYDLAYLRNWSVWFDVWIILKTVLAVLRDENAY